MIEHEAPQVIQEGDVYSREQFHELMDTHGLGVYDPENLGSDFDYKESQELVGTSTLKLLVEPSEDLYEVKRVLRGEKALAKGEYLNVFELLDTEMASMDLEEEGLCLTIRKSTRGERNVSLSFENEFALVESPYYTRVDET